MDERNPKYKIVKENMNLPADQIKKKLRELYPEITNDEVIELIINVDKQRKKSQKSQKSEDRDER